MSKLVLLVQLSDPHIGAEWGGGDPVAMLAAAVASVRALEPEPDAVLISGDLADTAAAAEYEQVLKLRTAVALPISSTPHRGRCTNCSAQRHEQRRGTRTG